MTEVLCFTIDGHRYGFRKNRVSSIEGVGAVHRLPFLRSTLTVLAVTGDRTRTLADLALCLGHTGAHSDGGANALLMSGQRQIKGFLLRAELVSHQVETDGFLPLPDYLSIPFIEGFLLLEGDLIPMVAMGPLFDSVAEQGNPPNMRSPGISTRQTPEPSSQSTLRLVSAGGNVLAFQAAELVGQPGRSKISRFPLLPPDADGVTIVGNQILPVVDLARRVSRMHVGEIPVMLEARLGSEVFGMLVDETHEEWLPGDTVIKDLPLICADLWSRKAALHGDRVAAIIDLATLLSTTDADAHPHELSVGYEPGSRFPSIFGAEEAHVIEVPVRGWHFAIPKDEVMSSVPCAAIHAVPHSPGIVVGVSAFEGELLPVLDLARIVGASSSPTALWRMIPVSNGSFRALVLSEEEPQTRLLKSEAQRDVPVRLPFPVVYGCYTVGEGIRLILNLHALTLHFDESRASELLATFPPVEVTRESELESLVGPDRKPEPDVRPEAEQEPEPDQKLDVEHEPTPKQEPELEQPAHEPQPQTTTDDVSAPAQIAPREAPTLSDDDQLEMPQAYTPEPAPGLGPGPVPEPAPAMASRTATPEVTEKESFAKEANGHTQTAVEQPARRGMRMTLAFVVSVLVISGAVYGLYFSGIVRRPSPPPAVAAVPAAAAPAPTPEVEQQPPIYIVKKGDTLWDIAQRLTGNPLNYHSLAGRNLIKNPDLIFPGQSIDIGPAQR